MDFTDDEINDALEEMAIWDVIYYHESRIEELDDLDEMTEEEKDEYKKKSDIIIELLDRIDDGD